MNRHKLSAAALATSLAAGSAWAAEPPRAMSENDLDQVAAGTRTNNMNHPASVKQIAVQHGLQNNANQNGNGNNQQNGLVNFNRSFNESYAPRSAGAETNATGRPTYAKVSSR